MDYTNFVRTYYRIVIHDLEQFEKYNGSIVDFDYALDIPDDKKHDVVRNSMFLPDYDLNIMKQGQDLYDKIKKNISEFYSKYVSDNENIDQQKISKLKDDSVNNIKEFFTRTLDVLTTAFHELPEWAQDAIKSGLKSFLVTWLLTGGNTNSASIVGTYMATRTALNKKIEEGSEDAAILKPISNEMAKGWLRGKILSGGDESVAAKSAVTSAIDQIVSQLSESEIKDKNQILKFIADHKSAIQSTTSVYSVSSILKHWGLSDTASNTLGVAVGGSEYLIDKGIEKVKINTIDMDGNSVETEDEIVIQGRKVTASTMGTATYQNYMHNIVKVAVNYGKATFGKQPTTGYDFENVDANGNPTQLPASNGAERAITLEAYFPIAFTTNSDFVWAEIPTQVVYDSGGGNPSYYKDIIKISNSKGVNVTISNCDVVFNDVATNAAYYPATKVKNAGEFYLRPNNMYLSGLSEKVTLVCKSGNDYWVQPLVIIQNRWPSAMLNSWDGSLTIDEKNGTIMSTMVGAGRKTVNNTFEGGKVKMFDLSNNGVGYEVTDHLSDEVIKFVEDKIK